MILVEGYTDGSNYGVDYYDYYADTPDDLDWEPDENNNPDSVEATLDWNYYSSVDYDVSSGLGWCSADAYGCTYAESGVSLDTDYGENARTTSTQSASTSISCVCYMTSN
jgi:hypothetical protein